MEKDFERDYEYEYEEEEEEEEEEGDDYNYDSSTHRDAMEFLERKEADKDLFKVIATEVIQREGREKYGLIDSTDNNHTRLLYDRLIEKNIKEYIDLEIPVPKTKVNSLYQLAGFVGGIELQAELKEYFTNNHIEIES